jgi:hypothetical protein
LSIYCFVGYLDPTRFLASTAITDQIVAAAESCGRQHVFTNLETFLRKSNFLIDSIVLYDR